MPASAPGAALRRAWTALSWLGVIAIAVSVLGAMALVAVPTAMGWKGMVVLSGSMQPKLKVGGIAFMQPIDRDHLDQLAVGDILTYRTPARNLVSHRIVEIDQTEAGPTYVTKGDANDAPDIAAVNASQVVGKVRFALPYAGRVIQKLSDRTTYYVVIGIPALLLILSELGVIYGEVRKSRAAKRASTAVILSGSEESGASTAAGIADASGFSPGYSPTSSGGAS